MYNALGQLWSLSWFPNGKTKASIAVRIEKIATLDSKVKRKQVLLFRYALFTEIWFDMLLL